MLGRRADQLYWMARYTERAENTARILDVTYGMSLVPQPADAQRSAWQSALNVAGDAEAFAASYGDASRGAVIRYLTVDRENPSSIFSSLRAARENARALRAAIPTEMWESLNATWLELQEISEDRLSVWGYRGFFDWIKERTILFKGIADGTMVHDEAYAFAQLGWNIERADSTARLLDSKYHILLPRTEGVGGAIDYYQWGAVLRSVGAFRAYHRIYRDQILPYRVAELLVLRRDLPRSLRACFDRIGGTLDQLCEGRIEPECRRRAGQIHARLRYGRIDEIFNTGLHEFLVEFIGSNASLGSQIQRDFMMVQ